jgi:Protein of unknown function (DUF3631)
MSRPGAELRHGYTLDDLDRLATVHLLGALCEREDGPWAGWWERDLKDARTKGPASRLAKLLKPFDVEPRQLKLKDGSKVRGYLRGDFEAAWRRYLPGDPRGDAPENGTTVPPWSEAHSGPEGTVPGTVSDSANHASDQQGTEVPFPSACVGPGAGSDDAPVEDEPAPGPGGQVFADTAAWAAAGRPGLSVDPGELAPSHRCGKCGKTARPPRMVAVYPHSGCGGLWVPTDREQEQGGG